MKQLARPPVRSVVRPVTLVRPLVKQLARLLVRSAARLATPVRPAIRVRIHAKQFAKVARILARLAIRVRALAIRFARMLVNPLLRPVLFAKPYAIRVIHATHVTRVITRRAAITSGADGSPSRLPTVLPQERSAAPVRLVPHPRSRI